MVSPSISRDMSLTSADFANMALVSIPNSMPNSIPNSVPNSAEIPIAPPGMSIDHLMMGTYYAPLSPGSTPSLTQTPAAPTRKGSLSSNHHKMHAHLALKNPPYYNVQAPNPFLVGNPQQHMMAPNPFLAGNFQHPPPPMPMHQNFHQGAYGGNQYQQQGPGPQGNHVNQQSPQNQYHGQRRRSSGGNKREFTRRFFGKYGSIVQCDQDKKLRKIMKEQQGSRFIQQSYKELTSSDQAKAVMQLLEKRKVYLNMVNHVYANWVIQIMYEHAKHDHRYKMVKALEGQMYIIALSKFGCRLIQRIVEGPNGPNDLLRKRMVVRELYGKTMALLANTQGHHVVEKILSDCTAKLCHPILEEILPGLHQLAVDPFGCQIIELILRKYDVTNPLVQKMMVKISENVLEMAQHRFGNYIVQDIIQHAPEALQDKIFKAVFADIATLGCSKFASNVVEKSIYLAANKRRRKLVRAVIDPTFQIKQDKEDRDEDDEFKSSGNIHKKFREKKVPIRNELLSTLVLNQFGNYVIQTLLLSSGKKDREKLMGAIRAEFPDLEQTSFGKHILDAMQRCEREQEFKAGDRRYST